MIKILTVCLGNICRSPMAEGILADKLAGNSFYIDSAGTANYHEGENPDRRAIITCKQHGIDISHLKARQISLNDFNLFDHILVMDEDNFKNVLSLAKNGNDKQKVSLILSHIPNYTSKNVSDPYYGNIENFKKVFQQLDLACTYIAEKLITKKF